ncbi:Tyw3, partial [Symbiodinium sp. KB8]
MPPTGPALPAPPAALAREFATRKANFLRKPDKSPKGAWDPRVSEICEDLNGRDDFFTTSSCSGRCFLWRGRHHQKGLRGFRRLRVSHDPVEEEFFNLRGLDKEDAHRPVWLSVQAFILHVCCRQLRAAKQLINKASKHLEFAGLYSWRAAGGKFMVEIQGGEHLEFPVNSGDGSLFEAEGRWLCEVVNDRLQRNWGQMAGFLRELRAWPEAEPFLRASEADGPSSAAPVVDHAALAATLCPALAAQPGVAVLGCLPAELRATQGSDQSSQGSWWHLDPLRLALRCRDRRAAGKVMQAAGTLFRKPELRPLPRGAWRLRLQGTERMSLPIRLPDGYEPYAGCEDWVRELVEH